MRLRLRAAGFFALAVIAITCTDAPTSPRDGHNVMSARHLSMSPSFSPAAAKVYGNLAAFGIEVTQVHVHLTGPDGSVRDTTIAFPVGQDTLTIDIPVDGGGTDQTYIALLELRNDAGEVLFSGTQSVVARTGNLTTDVPPAVVIQYVRPDARTKIVTVAPGDTTVGASATIATKATAIDSSGAPVTDLLVRWTTSDPTLATVTTNSNTTASVVGQGRRGTATISAITLTGIIGTSKFSFVPPPAKVVVVSGGGQTGVAGSVLVAPLVIEVQASDNLPVSGIPVTFRAVTAGGAVTTATATSDVSGRASTTLTLGKTGGTYQYEASSGALPVVTVNETATPAPPAAVAIVSGDAQTDSVGRALAAPLVVKVTDQYGGASSGATVTWARVTGSGTVGTATSTTGSDGLASTTYTLGNTVGGESISATVSGVSGSAGTTTFNATAISRGAAAIALVSGGGQSGAPGATLATPLVVRVADALNNPVANATVAWTAPSAGTTFTPASALTDALGQVSTTVKLGTTAGPVVASAATAALVATANLTIVPGPAAIIAKVDGDGQTAEVATNVAVAPSVKVTDASGNAIAGAAVVFSVASGGGSVTAASASTDASGAAAVGSWKLGNTVGANTLNATAGALSTTFTATAKSGSAAKLAFVAAPPASITVGAAIPAISARITDALDNPVAQAGTTVTATGVVTPGGGTTTLTAVTDASGLATFTLPPYVGPTGSVVLTLTATGLTSVASSPITAVAGAPAKIVIGTQPSATAASGAALGVQPVVQLADAGGNAASVAGVSVTATIGSGGGTLSGTQTRVSGADGTVAFTDLAISGTAGARTLAFSATGLTSATSNTITLGAGAAASMAKSAGDAQSATAGSTLPVAPSVIVTDASGNPVAGAAVTFAVATGGGSVTGPSATTNASGIAAVGSWKLGDAAGPNTLTATSGAFTATFSATGTVGSAAKLAFVAAPPATIVVGAAVPAISGRITDALNNAVASAGVTVTATAVVTPGGQTTTFIATTDATGLATFTPSPYDGVVGSIVLTLTSPGLTSVASSPITATVGAPAKLAIKTQPSSIASSGAAFAVQPVLQLTDVGNNPTSVAGTTVTAAISSGGGTLGGTLTATTTADGTASFTDLAITGTAGSRTLGFAGTGLTGTTSNAITVGAGAASVMSKNAGDGQTATVSTAVAVAPSVVVKDAAGNPVEGVAVTFAVASGGGSITAPTTTTNASGIATVGSWTLGSVAGANTLTATSGALTATFTATGTAGAPASITKNAGDAQTATVSTALPVAPSVMVKDAAGNPVAGASVTFAVASGGGSLTAPTTTTNAAGIATVGSWTLGSVAGANTLTATNGAFTTTFTATGTAGAPASISKNAGDAQTATVSTAVAVAPSAVVKDAAGNPVAGASVTFAVASGGGSITGPTTTTNASGIATVGSWTLGSVAGANSLTATSGAFTATFTATGTAGAVATLAKNGGDGQTATVSSTVPVAPSVVVKDVAGNPVAGASVTFAVATGGGSITAPTTTTNASGIATVGSWTLGSVAGANTLTATNGSFTTTFTATGTAGAAATLTKNAGDAQTATVGSAVAVAPSVMLKDAAGNPVAGASVTFAIASGAGSVTGPTTTTNASGIATVGSWTLGSVAGANSLTATSGAFTTTFTATGTAGAPASISKNAGDAQTATVSSTVPVAPSVIVKDAAGNPVAGASVNFAVASGGGSVTGPTTTTNASGIATVGSWTLGSVAGANSLTATNGSFTTTFTATGTAGAAASISKNAGDAQTATVSTAVAIAPSVVVKDAAGNPVAGASVTFAVASGGGSVTGPTTTTNASGIATIGSWTLGSVAGANTLTATNGSFTTTFTATGTAGAPASITKNAGDGQTATVSSTLPVAPSVVIKDASNNPVAGVSVTFAIASGGGSVTGPTTTTNASGIATVGSWTLGSVAGANTLTATSGAFTTTFTATGTAGAPASISKKAGDGQTATVSSTLPVAPSVVIKDASNNPVAGVNVTFAIASGGGSVTGPTTTTNASGIATVVSWTLGSVAGANSLTATSGAFTTTFTATGTAGAPASISKSAGDAQTATVSTAVAVAPSVVVKDAAGNPVAGASVTFAVASGGGSITAPTTTTNASGIATVGSWTLGSVAGANSLTATNGSFTTTFTATGTAGAPASISKIAGDAQTATVSTAVAIAPSVVVKDAAGNPVSGVTVTFAVASGGGGVTGPTTTTDASGIASVGSWTLGSTAGANTLTATSGALSTTFTATGTAGSPAKVKFLSGVPASITVGAAFSPISVEVRDANDNPVKLAGRSVTVTLLVSPSGEGGTLTATTNASGVATFTPPAYTGKVGTASITATSGSVDPDNVSGIPVTAGAFAKLVIATQPSSSVASGAVFATPPAVQLADVGGNAVAGSLNLVALKGVAGSYSLTGSTVASTDPSGLATFSALSLTGSAGVYSLKFTVSGGGVTSPVTNSFNLTAGAGTLLSIATQPSATATNGAPLATQPSIQLTDASGNPVNTMGVTVTASISSGSGSLASAAATTDDSGRATFAGLAITGKAGNFTLNFDATGYSTVASNTIALGAGVAAKLEVTTGFSDGQSGVPFSTQPVVRVLDSGDNPVLQAAIPVSVSIATGGGTLSGTTTQNTNASGVATFTDLVVTGTAGARTFAFSGPGLATISTGPVNVAAGSVAKLLITTAPPSTAQNDVAFTTQPVVQLADAADNPVKTAGVSIYADPDVGGSVRNKTAVTDANGVATFSGTAIQGLVGNYSLIFTSSLEGVSSAKSGVIALSAGLPAQLAFTQQPTDAVQNVAIKPAVTVTLQDDIGNVVTTGSYSAALGLTGGDASLSGTTMQPFVSGVATFSDLTVSLPYSAYRIVANTDAPGVSTATSSAFAITRAALPSIIVDAGSHVAVRPAEAIPTGKINFLVRDGSLKPVSGVGVNFTNSNSDECTFSTASTTTDATGHATLGINVGRLGVGCLVTATATGVELSVSAQVASVPLTASHAWIGGDASSPAGYEVKENWLNMSTRTPQLPSTSNVAYVPAWTDYLFPQLAFEQSVGGVVMDPGAYIDLGGRTLTTSADINAPSGWLYNGSVLVTGSGVNISGFFDVLTVGRAGSCGVTAPEFANLRQVITLTSLTVACGAYVDQAQAPTVSSLTGSFVKVNDSGVLLAQGSAAFDGDSLVIGSSGGVASYGDASFAGKLGMVSGSSIYVTGAAYFAGYGNNSGGGIDVQGDVTFSGSGRSGYYFDGGGMNLQGNFTQKGSGSAFNAGPFHTTYFDGAKPQTIYMERPSVNEFGTLNLQNDAGGVTLLSNLTFRPSGSDYAPSLNVYWSPLIVPAGDTITLNGYLSFYGGGTMDIDGAATYWSCYSDGLTSPLSGSGTANGEPVSSGGGCYFGGSYSLGAVPLKRAQVSATSVKVVVAKPVPKAVPPRPVARRTTLR